MPNIWAVQHDPQHYPHPDKFQPDRFLTPEGTVSTEEASKIMVFSSGQRRCVGENVAKQELFVLNACIMQKFRVELDPNTKGNPLTPKLGFTLSPGEHKLIFHSRTAQK